MREHFLGQNISEKTTVRNEFINFLLISNSDLHFRRVYFIGANIFLNHS